MHVIASRAQVTIAAAFHQLRFVTPTEHMTEKLVPMIEPDV